MTEFSNNPYAETQPFEDDPWIHYSRWALWVIGAFYILIGIGTGILMPVTFYLDPEIPDETGLIFGGVFGLLMFIISAGFGLVSFLAAWGLKQRRKWAWVITLIFGAMLAPSGCMPVGIVLLYGMLNDRTRKTFLG